MAGTIIADTLTHSTAGSVTTDYVVNGSAKMWCLWNQTGTVSIRDSFNAASLTDNGTGKGQVNLVSSMSNATYSYAGHHSNIGGGYQTSVINNAGYQSLNTSSQIRVSMLNGDGFTDSAYCGYEIFGDN